MSSVIVQMLPNLTLEPALMGTTAAGVCSTVLLQQGGAWELWSSSSVPEKCAFQLNWEWVLFLLFPAYCWSWAGGAALAASASSRSPCTHCQGQTLLWDPEPVGERDPGAGLGQAGQEHEYRNAPGLAATGLGPYTARGAPSSHL